jgi:acyl-CoA dehydrogenase
MQTRADRKGNDAYVLNGEKWFSSAASVADIALVMAKTDPDGPRLKQFSSFLVELPNPGYKIKRDIQTMALEGPLSHILGGGHSEVEITNLEIPAENLLGGEGNGFNMGQHRLAYGRLRHGMHNVAMAQRALDMATAHVTNRTTFGKKLDERQAVQFMLAECASQLYIARLMLLHIAYKAENKMDTAGGIAKVFSRTVHHGWIMRSNCWRSAIRATRRWRPGTRTYAHNVVDGPDEVHR